MVFNSIKNTNVNDPNFSEYNDAPYLLKLKQQQRRFVTRFNISTGSLEIQFGAGTVNDNDEEIIPNPNNVGIGLPFEKNKLTTAFSPTNFLIYGDLWYSSFKYYINCKVFNRWRSLS